jgi:hypothetical protein
MAVATNKTLSAAGYKGIPGSFLTTGIIHPAIESPINKGIEAFFLFPLASTT